MVVQHVEKRRVQDKVVEAHPPSLPADLLVNYGAFRQAHAAADQLRAQSVAGVGQVHLVIQSTPPSIDLCSAKNFRKPLFSLQIAPIKVVQKIGQTVRMTAPKFDMHFS